jgi:drug/metabolite transporter (DMT)-like permease
VTGASIAAYSLTDGSGGRVAGSAASYTAWMMLLCGITMPPIAMLLNHRNGGPSFLTGRSRRDLVQAFGGGVISVVGYAIVIWAMQRSPMGMVSALRETSVLFAALLGRVFLGEPFTLRKVVSAVLICGGVVCLH